MTAGLTRFHIAGYITCGDHVESRDAVKGIATIFPKKVIATIKEFGSRDEYLTWLTNFREILPSAAAHTTCPIVWTEDESGKMTYFGGENQILKWCRDGSYFDENVPSAPSAGSDCCNSKTVQAHDFDYDLIVIGGGSGGLATAKEAHKYGAKVAVLDFVKPSPKGSKWGLGGTCVNVGCIPKKLMHTAALLGEASKESLAFGWGVADDGMIVGHGKHNWELMKDNIQNHIKGTNFAYRVELREAGITYLNKLGRFTDAHTMSCTDNKGKVQVVTAQNFVIAVGGRPTPLDCPGSEHAITSDDLFMLASAPGRTCVIGAGYVALECAGFINGLHQGEVVVLVRSILLRGFDRDMVQQVQAYMEDAGIKIVQGVTPSTIVKTDAGLVVTFSDGREEVFDTVVAAVGRYSDTGSLGLETVGVNVNAKTGKILCQDEQTNIPHIYGIGDAVEGVPELTPVAIMSGKMLARRIYGSSHVKMIYKNIATTVFTPLELGTVGISEETAIDLYGEENILCYASMFQPLEWSLVERPPTISCMAKVVVLKADHSVLGMHIASPNAGEIIQGFAVAFRKGLVYQDLLDTVGIHPTVAEEFTLMTKIKAADVSLTKSSC